MSQPSFVSPSRLSAATGALMPCAASSARPYRLLTELDHLRISKQLAGSSRLLSVEAAAQLEDVLENAELIASHDVPPDVVTMYSQMVISGMPGDPSQKLTLCYPADAEPSSGFVSVFSPVGTALLGLMVGQLAQWMGPDAKPASAQILSISFQPESSGDYLL